MTLLRNDSRTMTPSTSLADLSLGSSISVNLDSMYSVKHKSTRQDVEDSDSYDENADEVVAEDRGLESRSGANILIGIAKRFFAIFFSDSDRKMLPYSLCYVIRELFLLLRQEFSNQPVNDHIKVCCYQTA